LSENNTVLSIGSQYFFVQRTACVSRVPLACKYACQVRAQPSEELQYKVPGR